MMVAGDMATVGPQAPAVAAWHCGASPILAAEPPTCPRTAPLGVRIAFPDCWDGEHLDSDDHRSHVARSDDGRCPDDHPVAIPQLIFEVHYPVTGDPDGLELASGGVHGVHADFLNAWDQDTLEREVRVVPQRRQGLRGRLQPRHRLRDRRGRHSRPVASIRCLMLSPSPWNGWWPSCRAAARPGSGQREMADAVRLGIAERKHLAVQAGTGTGKTLAYLVPAILSGRRTVVATATKALQDQLAGKDLPFLEQHLDHPFAWAVLEGAVQLPVHAAPVRGRGDRAGRRAARPRRRGRAGPRRGAAPPVELGRHQPHRAIEPSSRSSRRSGRGAR